MTPEETDVTARHSIVLLFPYPKVPRVHCALSYALVPVAEVGATLSRKLLPLRPLLRGPLRAFSLAHHAHISSGMAAITKQTYTPAEQAEIAQWQTTAERLAAQTSTGPDASILDALNTHLSSRTTVLGSKPSFADVELYKALAPAVKAWSAEQRTGKEGRPHIVRHLDFVQNSAGVFGLDVADADKISVNLDEVLYVKSPEEAKAEKERLKKEKAAAAADSKPAETKTVVDRTKEAASKAAGKVAEAKDKVAAAVAGEGAAAAAEGGNQKKKEKKEKAPKPQK
ncbi:hypothetical protein MAPG_11724, partial [Magnaporthiopsis poae ATCC 64411]